ncbi:LysR family transcriptional regulator [Crenobacter cavernae]|uniref:LysR family transcriptional regulator n=1 Tax=Crenobacter cavernae TaxID=2290923 RepID=A0ABY0FIR5_9NEIS|nr:LysR family transcriptional regulator [Crenobacter cavernae]RXZ45611.1 LysR family transcriptional regulator [Crenobacter cavernae]
MLGQLSDLDLRLIRVFLAVVEAGGVSAAQSTLNVSQSTISSQLSALETRLGYRLCERGRAGFALTPKGTQFVAASRRLLEAVDDFTADARRLDRRLVGQLRIGVIGHTAMSANARLSEAIRRFRERDEAVELTLSMLPPGTLEEAVINGVVQVGIGYFWHRVPSLDYVPLFSEHQVAYCGHGHPLFDAAGAHGFDAVSAHDWVWRSYPLPDIPLPTENWRVTARADNMEAVAVLILSGHHLGFLPEHFAATMVEQGLLAPLNPGTLYYDATFHMVTRQQARRGEVLQAFLDDMIAAHADTH